MSTIGRPIRNPRVGHAGRAVEPSGASTPYRLLWSTGIIAFGFGMAAFVLWGINGAGTLFDMIAAICT